MSLYGAVVALLLIATGHRPMRWDYCVCFEAGHGWGGMEMGMFFVTEKGASAHLKCHEHGHGIQNCYFGPFMPILVCIPSSLRYWVRRFIGFASPKRYYNLPDYDAVWFEGQASSLGKRLHRHLESVKGADEK